MILANQEPPPPPPPIRLLIADDHRIVREGLKQIFDFVSEIVVVGEASDGAETMTQVARGGIDLLVLDLSMPGISGERLIADLRARFPAVPILVLSMHNEPQVAQRAIRAGAAGYLTKECDIEDLLAALRKVASGGRFLDPQLAQQVVFAAAAQSGHSAIDDLTTREFEVLRLITGGLSINQTAAQLGISNKTVSTHKARLMKKLGTASNADLVRYAIAQKISQ